MGWLAGCDNRPQADRTDTGCGPAEVSVEVGTGSEAFTSLTEGGDLPFVQGPQGGYHVYAGVRAEGIYPGDPRDPFGPDSPRITFRVTAGEVLLGAFEDQPRPLTDGALVGERVVFTVADPPSLDGTAAVLEGLVVDRCGRSGADARGVVLRYQVAR